MTEKEPYILALDASTTAAGWAEAKGDEYLASGVFEPLGKEWWWRIRDMERWLRHTLAYSFSKGILAYEKATGYHKNVDTDRKLGAVEFVILCVAEDIGWKVVSVTASQVRASGCHKGLLSVAESIVRAKHPDFEFDLSTKAAEKLAGDRADAIGVWLAARKKMKAKEWLDANSPG